MARWLVIAVVALGCGAQHERSSRADRVEDPKCDRLPRERPRGAVLRVGRVDGESLTHTLDAALVADAACPTSLLLENPRCVHLTDEAMDYVWNRLVTIEPHAIVVERRGECIHCGGPWLSIEWPGGRCDRGTDHFHEVVKASWDRLDRAVHVLEAAAAAGGVEATRPPR